MNSAVQCSGLSLKSCGILKLEFVDCCVVLVIVIVKAAWSSVGTQLYDYTGGRENCERELSWERWETVQVCYPEHCNR